MVPRFWLRHAKVLLVGLNLLLAGFGGLSLFELREVAGAKATILLYGALGILLVMALLALVGRCFISPNANV